MPVWRTRCPNCGEVTYEVEHALAIGDDVTPPEKPSMPISPCSDCLTPRVIVSGPHATLEQAALAKGAIARWIDRWFRR